MFVILKFLPRKLISRVAGVLASIEYPSFIFQAFLKNFVQSNKIDASEFELPLSEFKSFNQFFVRDLKASARPIEDGIVSPVDGAIQSVQVAENGVCLQVKGINYTVDELIGEEVSQSDFVPGEVYTLYLAPRDYHHIHVPVDSVVKERIHVPGTLWPVNDWSINNIPKVFCVNERIVLRMDSEVGEYFLVMVGATNVGSIGLTFEDLRTNKPGLSYSKKKLDDVKLAKGERAGTFYLGSTVVLVFGAGKTSSVKNEGEIKLGQVLAKN